jgi:hypothetical protein
MILILLAILIIFLAQYADRYTGSHESAADVQLAEISAVIKKYKSNLRSHDAIYARPEFSEQNLWGLPTPREITQIAKFITAHSDRVVSFGAGRGLWEALLSVKTSIPIIAIDSYPHQAHPDKPLPMFYDVQIGDANNDDDFARIVGDNPFNTVFASWPALHSPGLTMFLRAHKPKYLIYVGESRDGCTGDDSLFDLLDTSEKIKTFDHVAWGGMFDYCAVYKLNL